MKNLGFRITGISFLLLLCIYFSFPWQNFNINMPYTGKDYKLGLDLQGGVELDYKVDLTEVRKDPNNTQENENNILEGLKSIIDKRIESLKISDSSITTATYGNEKHIIVQIPLKGSSKDENNLNIQRAKEAIGKVMKIEFKELRNEITQQDYDSREQISKDFLEESLTSNYSFSVLSNKYKDSYENIGFGEFSMSYDELKSYLSLENDLEIGLNKNIFKGNYFLPNDNSLSQESGYWILNVLDNSDNILNIEYLFIGEKPSEWISAKDSKDRILNDAYFVNSSVQTDPGTFQPVIELTFNNEGAKIFGELTQRLIGKPIAIFVGGELLTSPTVQTSILSGKAIITGEYTFTEAKQLSNDINTGIVPAPIYLTSEKSIDSKLGLNSLEQLIIAGIYGFILIFIFLLIFYRFSGLMASIALFMYCLIVLVLIKQLGVVLTLASIAGLVLSIGMAIDANILIFERIKEELRSGEKLENAIEKGFKTSWSAIMDSNITGLIISAILYVFGINMIKGFGLTLGIGLIVSLFSAMFISRLLIVLLGKTNISVNSFIGFKK
ncbi:MAG: protein translocase subunit SecD [Candidatus Gracilibacteria bacterium]|nr:protein translocase subunit SecD [Candidatus Gracilibacteria bacterium]